MDLDLTTAELGVVRAVSELADQTGARDQLLELSQAGALDDALEERLRGELLGVDQGLLPRALVVEEVARCGLPVGLGMSAMLEPELSHLAEPVGRVAIFRPDTQDPVRYADVSGTLVLLGEDRVTTLPSSQIACEQVVSSSSYRFSRVSVLGVPRGIDIDPELVSRRWALCLCAEISGNLRGALELTSQHLRSRVQFGSALSQQQALRHRVSEAAVDVESVSWLTRRAAWRDDRDGIQDAAVQAEAVASRLVGELTQLVGARGFALEFRLHIWTMRSAALRAELNGWLRANSGLDSPVPLIGQTGSR